MVKSIARLSAGEVIGLILTVGATLLFSYIFLRGVMKVLTSERTSIPAPYYLLGIIAITWTSYLVKRLKNWKNIIVDPSGLEVNYILGNKRKYPWEQIIGTWQFHTHRRSLGQAIKLFTTTKEIIIVAAEFSNYNELLEEIALYTKEISNPSIIKSLQDRQKKWIIIITIIVLVVFIFFLFVT